MEIPQRLWRFATSNARDTLATRFGLRNEPGMQDWEWEVADPSRVEEFLAAYESGELSDDERCLLIEPIIQPVFDVESLHWKKTQFLLEANIELHIHTVCYWACLNTLEEEDGLELAWNCAPAMRAILNRHRVRFDFPPHDV